MRLDVFDVLVGINLLREGLDIPEISLVAILDADKEGFLRSETSLIQTIGRAAQKCGGTRYHVCGRMTDSMRSGHRRNGAKTCSYSRSTTKNTESPRRPSRRASAI